MGVNYIKKNVGCTYVDILKVILLSHRKYRSDITHDNWRDLFLSTVDLYKSPPTHVEHSVIVEILNIIVMHGSCQSDLCGLAKELYPTIRATFQSNQFCRSKFLHQERLLQLSITLCS
ncbi:Uncharacterized protein GBIM_22119, partial [Gryllus bimaculatus]